ncbi:MAG: D-glycerate dehydrogenase [Hyphomicrobiales bacterium]|nr:D-glycerate dehydrogenase [Hyphomicrobiales bacterium]
MPAKPTILVTRKLPDAVEARLRRDFAPRLNPEDKVFSSDELIDRAAGADGLLVCPTDKLTAAVIERLPETVRIVASFSVGYDHVDIAAAKARGLVVTNTPDVLSDATAEIAILLMLAAARRAGEGERLVRADDWTSWAPTFMLGRQISGKRFGVLGMGKIGRITAARARGFGMEIHYHNRSRLDPALEADAIFHDTVEDLLAHCDVLSIHCPATPETDRLINERTLALLPDGAIVVNTARGNVIDDEALIAALRSGRLYAAGLDVFNNEPAIHPGYRTLSNVVLLPHLGSATIETRDAMGFRALDNLDAYFAGKEPGDRVA